MKVKKIVAIIVITMLILAIGIKTVKAEDYSFSFTVDKTEINAKQGESIVVNLGISDINQSTDGINALQGDLSYDESVFENVELVTVQDNWSVTLNQLTDSDLKGRFVISNLTNAKDTQVIAQLKATVKSDAESATGYIYLKNVFTSYGTTETEKQNKTITVKINQTANNKIVNDTTQKSSNTTNKAKTKLPQTGFTDWIIIGIIFTIIFAIVQFIRYKKTKA